MPASSRTCRVYGWAEKKTKASWGGSTVDYKTIAGKAVREMNTQELQHFLVVCALASDLGCPGYNPRQALRKESNLARTAIRYKIDTEKVSATVRDELSKPVKGARKKKGAKAAKEAKPEAGGRAADAADSRWINACRSRDCVGQFLHEQIARYRRSADPSIRCSHRVQ